MLPCGSRVHRGEKCKRKWRGRCGRHGGEELLGLSSFFRRGWCAVALVNLLFFFLVEGLPRGDGAGYHYRRLLMRPGIERHDWGFSVYFGFGGTFACEESLEDC